VGLRGCESVSLWVCGCVVLWVCGFVFVCVCGCCVCVFARFRFGMIVCGCMFVHLWVCLRLCVDVFVLGLYVSVL